MIFAWIRFGLCALCLITAMICFTAAVLGANRFGFIMNRVHAGGVGDTLGLFLIALSIILQALLHHYLHVVYLPRVFTHSDSG